MDERERSGPTEPERPAPAAARMVVFRAGGERFALPLESVREVVVPQPPFARVPKAADAVRGAMNLRGRVVAVVELAPLLGLPADQLGPAQGHVLILDRAPRGLGLLVAVVLGVQALGVETGGARGAEPRFAVALGLAELGGAPVTVLDAEAVEARAASLFQP